MVAAQNPDALATGQHSEKSRAGGCAQGNLLLEPHICRKCFGRLVSTRVTDEVRLYQCTNCGHEAESESAEAVCCCGIRLRKSNAAGRSGGALVDAGIRCVPNPNPSPAFPSLYVASEVASVKKPRK